MFREGGRGEGEGRGRGEGVEEEVRKGRTDGGRDGGIGEDSAMGEAK